MQKNKNNILLLSIFITLFANFILYFYFNIKDQKVLLPFILCGIHIFIVIRLGDSEIKSFRWKYFSHKTINFLFNTAISILLFVSMCLEKIGFTLSTIILISCFLFISILNIKYQKY